MNNIFIISRAKFKEEIKSFTEQQFMDTAFISIHSPKIGMSFNDTDPILSDSSNVLNLWFHDTDPSDDNLLIGTHREPVVPFDEQMAKSIKRFVENNKDKKQWLIHCTAGVCRSGAVGECLSDYFGNDYHKFKRDNPQIKPNVFVKKILKYELEKESNQ